MRRRFQRSKPKIEPIRFIANDWIRAYEVFLIDEEGRPAGNMPTSQALARARGLEMDLVLVNPKALPPVAKIADLGQLKYETEKKMHKQKVAQKKVDTKEIRLSVRIGDHDFNFRLEKAKEFLGDGDKVRVEVVQKGREKQHPDKAIEMIRRFENELKKSESMNVAEEQGLTKEQGRFSIVLINKK
jgi:translation initiation factor IF-3